MARNPETQATKPQHPVRRAAARWARAWRAFLPFARRHRSQFWKATAAAFLTVGCRLAFPWPLRALLGPWLESDGAGGESAALLAPALEDVLPLAALFFAIILVLGLAEFYQRLAVARFSIAWVRDIRAEAFRAAHRVDSHNLSVRTGDLVARLIGDTARLKAGLKGFLVHVATNGILFVGVTLILMWIDVRLGAVMAVACSLVLFASLWGAYRVFERYLKLRKKEGKLADRIQEALEEGPEEESFARVNYSSGQHEASVVRIQGITTFVSHAVLGLAALVAIAIGVSGLQSQRIDPSDLFIFFLYVVTLHRPAVRLARQGTRIGKMMACGDRLYRLLSAARKVEDEEPLPPLGRELRLKALTVGPPEGEGGNPRLAGLDFRIPAGQKVVIVGTPGSGKSTLLEVLAGNLERTAGKILWDERKLHKVSSAGRSRQLAYLSEQPFWSRRPLRSLLKGHDSPVSDALLELTGAADVIARQPEGLDTPVGSSDLSRGEARRVALARLLASDRSLYLLDDPALDLDPNQVRAALASLGSRPQATVMITASSRESVPGFDRVLELREGRIVADSAPFVPEPEPLAAEAASRRSEEAAPIAAPQGEGGGT